MHGLLNSFHTVLVAQVSLGGLWNAIWPYLMIMLGFSAVIFVHEMGHFLAAKWAGVRVERFAIGFFSEVVGFTIGETRYSLNILPLGGYVKMLGQEDFEDKDGEIRVKEDPRAFSNKPVFHRMVIVSAGVVMNILFAAFLFVIVFMHGTETLVTTVGRVIPESPAALAGLQPGDTILRINDKKIREYQEIKFAVMLADPHTPLDFEIERHGEIIHITVKPEPEQQKNLLQVGISPATTRRILGATDHRYDPGNPKHLRPNDVIVAIEGETIDDSMSGGIGPLLRSADGSPTTVTVERASSADPEGPTEELDVLVLNEMYIDPSDPFEEPHARGVLGLIPLVRVSGVVPSGRAELAGLIDGDTILRIGSIDSPTPQQINQAIRDSLAPPPSSESGGSSSWRQRLYDRWTWNPERSISVLYKRQRYRAGTADLTPKTRGQGKTPNAGFGVNGVDSDLLQVSGVLPRIHGQPTPAAEAGIPKGARILQVGDTTVSTWPELVESFRLAAGTTVPLKYVTTDKQEVTREFRVPHSLRTKLGLSTLASIIEIDGKRFVPVEGPNRRVNVAVSYSYGTYKALSRALERNGGEPITVTVAYRESPSAVRREASVEIMPDMVDPWLGRIKYGPNVFLQMKVQMFKASGPIEAMEIGVRKTAYFVFQVYTMMQRMIFSRTVGVEHISGPVGIVKLGSDVARVGFVKLLFLLAIISANLAVINFLPLPIVDGGLMVFLIIEKIKGSPVSLKVQVVTQVIGLFLIGAVFLFVTFQDVVRLAE